MGNSTCRCLEGVWPKGNQRHAGTQQTNSASLLQKAWASPVPKPSPLGRPLNGGSVQLQLDMVMEEDDAFEGKRATGPQGSIGRQVSPSGVRLDTDGKLRRPDAIVGLPPSKMSRFQAEQLLSAPGTLPPPLTRTERDKLIQKLLPTASHEMLARLPPELVQARSQEGQALRCKLVKGSTVVFFTAGYAGKRFVFERAYELGVKSVVIEHPDSWSRGLLEEGLISKFIPIDMSQSSDVILKESLEIIANLGNDGVTGRADAVCTFVELSVPLVARLCERLGLPGPTPEAVDKARDKHATRAALKANGLPTPRNMLIRSEADMLAAAQHVGFPAVLKPISGAASLGVKKVTQQDQLVSCYREVVKELSSLVVVSGALVQNDGSGSGVAAESAIDTTVLLEQYLDGNEVDVDVIVSDGEWRYAAVTDNGPTVEPYFNETYGVCPSLLPIDRQRQLKELAIGSVKALGFRSGVFHVECKYTSTGPQLIEVNARMGGGPVFEHNLRTWGVNLVEEAIFIALGIPARPAVPDLPLKATAYYLVPAAQSGVVQQLPDLDALRKEDGVVWAKGMVKAGDNVVGPAEGMPTWMLDILVTKPTAKEALDFVLDYERNNPVKIK